MFYLSNMIPVQVLRRYVKKCFVFLPVLLFSYFVIRFYFDDLNRFSKGLVKTYQIENPNPNGDNLDAGVAVVNKIIDLKPNERLDVADNSVAALGRHQNIKTLDERPEVFSGEEYDDDLDELKMEKGNQLAEPLPQPDGPGEMGTGLKIDREQLTEEQKLVYDKGWQNNAFNEYVSDKMSLHRTLPDPRLPECSTIDYGHSLPEACVIIVFHNEAWSVLLRTVHSVLDRSPPHLLKEIILVDDFSDFDHLKKPLEEYINKLPKVRLLRGDERSGLIRARLLGFESCAAPVAVFLDSHCEVVEGWLEPLVSRISVNETNVAVPIIDIINDDTFQLTFSSDVVGVGGFNWELLYTWHNVPEKERQRNNYKSYLPIRSPTMAGGLFAISTNYFRKIGRYDTGMDIWGGENLELSFKTWMCGGTLEIVPCSHVGHVFRSRSPYKWTKGQALRRNLARVAEVWMDEFKFYYYERTNQKMVVYGDVSDRKELRRRLQCKNFKWYLNNIYPELFIPNEALASGEIRSAFKPICADAKPDEQEPIIGYPCHNQGGNQDAVGWSAMCECGIFCTSHLLIGIPKSKYWMLTKENEIKRDKCWDSPDGRQIITYYCHGQHGNQEFVYKEDDTIRSKTYNKCVELSLDGKDLYLSECNNTPRQQWKWNRKQINGPTKD